MRHVYASLIKIPAKRNILNRRDRLLSVLLSFGCWSNQVNSCFELKTNCGYSTKLWSGSNTVQTTLVGDEFITAVSVCGRMHENSVKVIGHAGGCFFFCFFFLLLPDNASEVQMWTHIGSSELNSVTKQNTPTVFMTHRVSGMEIDYLELSSVM